MKVDKVLLAILVFSVSVCVPALSQADVKVTLKNGREIIADTCRENDGKLVCSKMGGTFDIEIDAVASVKEVKGGGDGQEEAEQDSASQTQPQNKTDGTSGDNSADREGQAAGAQATAPKRLEEISQRKKELSSERKELVKEREQLQEDIKKAPDWMPTDKFDDLNTKNEKLTEKIRLFNEEATRLGEEEKKISEGLKKKD